MPTNSPTYSICHYALSMKKSFHMKESIRKNTIMAVLLLAFISMKNAFSMETESEKSGPTPKKSWQISIGLGAASKNNIRKDNNDSGKDSNIANYLKLSRLSLIFNGTNNLLYKFFKK